MKYVYRYLSFFTLFSFTLFGQTSEDVKKIVNSYDLLNINNLRIKYDSLYKLNHIALYSFAFKNNFPLKYVDKNGKSYLLSRVINNKPIYKTTFNRRAGISTRANFLHDGGGLGLNIEGQNMRAYVWDGGHVLLSHDEFNIGGNSKVVYGDVFGSLSDHATHVTGTICALGFDNSALGIAPQSEVTSSDWDNDLSEVTNATTMGMLVSNHSYGFPVTALPDWEYGAYTIDSRRWDNILFNAPYYSMVIAAGNDGDDSVGNSEPLEGNSNFDKLSDYTVSKNPIVVANGVDLFPNSITGAVSINNINLFSSSSQGPTDDYRIKPDITGNGVGLYSSVSTGDSDYDIYYGTSMAAPTVTGSLLLLQQLYNEENNNFAFASTIKGLLLHTADDDGHTVGPDAKFGWGYINSRRAAEVILNDNYIISERDLDQGETLSFIVTAEGVNTPLVASISWTDPPANNVNYGFTNATDPVLNNDLDIRIEKDGIVYMPWKLTGVDSNTRGDNIVDPFERIDIDNPSGQYVITISHKGVLQNSHQNYSLIISGISQNNLVLSDNISKEVSYVWPNPSEGFVNVSIGDASEMEIFVYDLLGKVVYENHINLDSGNGYNFDFNFLNTGVYSLIIKDNRGKIYNNKLIIK